MSQGTDGLEAPFSYEAGEFQMQTNEGFNLAFLRDPTLVTHRALKLNFFTCDTAPSTLRRSKVPQNCMAITYSSLHPCDLEPDPLAH